MIVRKEKCLTVQVLLVIILDETYLNFDDLKWRYISDVTSLNAFCINRMRNIFHVPGHRVKHELRKILRAVTKHFSYHKRENSMMLSI